MLQYLSAITSKICSNLACRSNLGAMAPLLPHRNFIKNSVLNISNVSSSILASPRTISAFLWYVPHKLSAFLVLSKCANSVLRPKSCVLASHAPKQTEDKLLVSLLPRKSSRPRSRRKIMGRM